MTIIKIHNPVLRFVAGLAMLVFIIAAGLVFCYGVGRLTLFLADPSHVPDVGDPLDVLGTIIVGVGVGAIIFLVSMLCWTIGDELFYMHPVLNSLAVLGAGLGIICLAIGLCYVLGLTVLALVPESFSYHGATDLTTCGFHGFLVLACLYLLGVLLKAGYNLGEKHFDP